MNIHHHKVIKGFYCAGKYATAFAGLSPIKISSNNWDLNRTGFELGYISESTFNIRYKVSRLRSESSVNFY